MNNPTFDKSTLRLVREAIVVLSPLRPNWAIERLEENPEREAALIERRAAHRSITDEPKL